MSPTKDTAPTASATRLFREAEAYCAKLGGGAHLGSINSYDEKTRINAAFTSFPFFSELKQVWIGLSNIDPSTGKPSDGWRWSDGRTFDSKLHFEEWAPEMNKQPKASEAKCVYVDTEDEFKWKAEDCDTFKLPEMLCERYEDKCASDANTCSDKDACVMSQLDGDTYCACKPDQQISSNGKTCEACKAGQCTFKVGPKAPAGTSVVVRTLNVPHDQMISDGGIQVRVTSLTHSGTAGLCPQVSDSLVVRHVDDHSGEFTECWNADHPELVFDLKTPCRNGPEHSGFPKGKTVTMKPGNPCAGKVGGRIELVATEVVKGGELVVINPVITLGKTVTPDNIKCYQCGDADWIVSENGLEYHLLSDGIGRTFVEAENACQKLGGGAHLGSLTDEGEKFALNRAFADKISGLTDVWFGLTNYNILKNEILSDSKMFWTDGQEFDPSGEKDWWEWKAGSMPDMTKEVCTWVDTKDSYKWGAGDCRKTTKPAAICERFEDACATASQFQASGGCGSKEDGGSGKGICLNQLNGQYYCSCPEGEQLSPFVEDVGAHHCQKCPESGCTFSLQGIALNSNTTANENHMAVQVVRHVRIPADHSVTNIGFTATLTVPGGAPCPLIKNSFGVRHVDGYTGEYTYCSDGGADGGLTVDMTKCNGARNSMNVDRHASAGDPCVGKIGGRLELVGFAYGVDQQLQVDAPLLTVTLSDGPVADECVAGAGVKTKKKKGVVVVVVFLVLLLVVGGGYAAKVRYERPTVHYSIQVNDDDDDMIDDDDIGGL